MLVPASRPEYCSSEKKGIQIHRAEPDTELDDIASVFSGFNGTSTYFGSKYPTLAPLELVLDFTQDFLTSARSLVTAFFLQLCQSGDPANFNLTRIVSFKAYAHEEAGLPRNLQSSSRPGEHGWSKLVQL